MEEAGVKLVAENEAQFYAAMQRAYDSVGRFGEESGKAAKGVGLLEAEVKRALRVADLTDRLQTQQKQLGILQKELAQTAAKYGEASTAAQRKALALEKLEASIRSSERELAALKTATAKAADGFQDGAQKISKSSEILTGALRRVGELATNAFLEAGQAAARFAVNTVKTAGDFESNMLRFGAVTGDSLGAAGLSLKDFSDLFLQLGKDTQFSAAQAQEAAINLAKGGLDPAVISAGGLSSALALAAAGELDLAQAAEITAKQYGVWVDRTAPAAEQAAFLAKSADLLAQAANASTVDVDELGLGLANVGGIAKTTGLSFQETVETLALLSPGFSSASDAGTSFKVFLTRLQPTTKSAQEAMARLNLLTAEGKSVFFDASGEFVGMSQASELLQGSLEKLNPAQKQAALAAIFGQDAFRTAALLAEQGAEGYARNAAAMAASGTAADVAAQKNQGFNFAVDALLGSLETFQIVAGTLVLPVLTALINEGLIPATNALTLMVEGIGDPNTTFGLLASVISTVATPALAGLTAAVIAYAVAQAVQATPALLASIPAIQAQAAALLQNTAATAAAVAPYALLAATVGAVVYKYQELGVAADARFASLMQTQPALVAATAAETAYAGASKATQEALTPYKSTLDSLKGSYAAAVEELTRLEAYGWRTKEQQAAQKEVIAQLEGQINTASIAMQGQAQSLVDLEAKGLTATARINEMASAQPTLQGQLSLTEDQLNTLHQAMETTWQQGAEAVGAFVMTEASFLEEAEGRRETYNATITKLQAELGAATTAEQAEAIRAQIAEAEAGYKEQEQAAAASYAQQQAAQRAHLGQMLIDYTSSQEALGNIGTEEAARLKDAIAQEYGVVQDVSAMTFLEMTRSIDSWAANAVARQEEAAGSAQRSQELTSSSIDALITDLGEQEQAAVSTRQQMDEYATEYVAEAVANFTEKQQEASDYAQALRNIPTDVSVRIRVLADPVPEDLRRRSPSPLEQALANSNALAKQLANEGFAKMKEGFTAEGKQLLSQSLTVGLDALAKAFDEAGIHSAEFEMQLALVESLAVKMGPEVQGAVRGITGAMLNGGTQTATYRAEVDALYETLYDYNHVVESATASTEAFAQGTSQTTKSMAEVIPKAEDLVMAFKNGGAESEGFQVALDALAASGAAMGSDVQTAIDRVRRSMETSGTESQEYQDAIDALYQALFQFDTQATTAAGNLSEYADATRDSSGAVSEFAERTEDSSGRVKQGLDTQAEAAGEAGTQLAEYANADYEVEVADNLKVKKAEVEAFAQKLRDIPTHIKVRIEVDADPPPEYLERHSPSPLEQAIANSNALAIQASQEGLPMMAASLGDVAEAGQAAFGQLSDRQNGMEIIEGLIDGIEYAAPLVDAAMGKVSGDIIDQFTSLAEQAREIGAQLAENLLGGQASSSRQVANNRKTVEGLRKTVADEAAAIAAERQRLSKREATMVNGELVFDQAKYDADTAALARREKGAAAQKGILAEAEAALKAARNEEAALFDATGDRAAAADLFSFRSGQIAELTQARLAAATGGDYERKLLDDIVKAQADEFAAFQAELTAKTGATQRAASGLAGLGSSINEDLAEGFRWRNQVATTGKDDKGKKYGKEQQEAKAVEAAQYKLLQEGLAPFLTYLTQVSEGTATSNPFKNLQTPNTDPFGQYGGQIGWVNNDPVIVPNTITTSPEGVAYGLWGKAPNFWPRDVEVPSDVSLTNAIPDRWEHRWQLQGAPGQRGPVYIGPKPPGQSMAPRFGDEWVQNAAGEWVIHKLPQYARGVASAPAGLSMVHAGELLINMRGGETVVPAAQVPAGLGQGPTITNNYNTPINWSPNYHGNPPAEQMDYALLRLLAQ
jgi:TP901 family phage tail tape measure protein